MFAELFTNPEIVARHRNAPYVEERERYLRHLADGGYTRSTMAPIAHEILWVARRFSRYQGRQVSLEEIRAAATLNYRMRRRLPSGRTRDPKRSRKFFIMVATRWLRFRGLLREAEIEPTPFGNLIEDFVGWMENERGLSPRTIQTRCISIGKFLRWYASTGRPISAVQITDIDKFLAARGKEGWSRITVAGCAARLRAFFRYAGMRRWCPSSIADAIQGPRLFSKEGLPSGPSWQDVQKLIASLTTDRTRDVRNRPIVMLFAIYGLRASEVSRLTLEDIDWENNRMLVRRSKRGFSQTYPLIPAVGNAIVRYLQKVRPQCPYREVFLTLRPPFRPMFRSGFAALVKHHMDALKIRAPHRGPHSLRHACATHLLSKGLSFKEIGDHLGHRRSCSAEIYAKVDLPGLRKVAAFDLGGLS